MKPTALPTLAQVRALPALLTRVIPPEYQDENGHMNMRWYLALYDDAGYPLVQGFGLSAAFHAQHRTGGFDLEHHIHYLNEIAIGDQVTVYVRMVGRSARRIHYLMFLVNDSHDKLASIFECVNSFADLSIRRTAPYPPEIAARIDPLVAQHQALEWPAPVCGVMGA
jgi:acyl-CoA thioester hydrolase